MTRGLVFIWQCGMVIFIMKAVYISHKLIDDTLANEPVEGKQPLEPFESFAKENGVKLSILEDCKVTARAEVHCANIDMFQCLEGEVEFVTGGELEDAFIKENPDGTKNELEIRAPSIKDGEVTTLVKGDIIWIPAGVPHLHRTDGVARLLVIKIPSKDVFPLEQVSGLKL